MAEAAAGDPGTVSGGEKRLIVVGALPPSSNNIYFTGSDGKRYLTKIAKAYRREIQATLMVAGAKELCPEPPFYVQLHLRFPDKRRRDLSNQIKLLEDSVFKWLGYDDSLVYSMTLHKYLDRQYPGVVMEIRNTTRKLEV